MPNKLRVVVKQDTDADDFNIENISNVQIVKRGFFPSRESHVLKKVELVVVLEMADFPTQAQLEFLNNLKDNEGIIEEYHFYDASDKLIW